MADPDDDDNEDDNTAGPVPIADIIAAEVRNCHAEKGQPMHVVGENNTLLSDPLVWWKAHVEKFPIVGISGFGYSCHFCSIRTCV